MRESMSRYHCADSPSSSTPLQSRGGYVDLPCPNLIPTPFVVLIRRYSNAATILVSFHHSLKKAASRAGTTLMQKTGQIERTVDREFAEEEGRYRT